MAIVGFTIVIAVISSLVGGDADIPEQEPTVPPVGGDADIPEQEPTVPPVGGDADIPEQEPTVPPTAVKTLQEQVEGCLDLWDGHHNGFQDQIRPLLNDEESMQVHNTYYGTSESAPGKVAIRMVYSALNALGGRVKAEAEGVLDYKTCAVVVLTTGLE